MSGPSGYSITREKIKTLMEGATSGGVSPLVIAAGRVFLGWYARQLTDSEAEADARANGPFAVIGLPSGEMPWYLWGITHVPIWIYISKPKQNSWDGKDVEDLVSDVFTRLHSEADYTAGAIFPEVISLDEMEYDSAMTPGLLVVKLRYDFYDPPYDPPESVLAANRRLLPLGIARERS